MRKNKVLHNKILRTAESCSIVIKTSITFQLNEIVVFIKKALNITIHIERNNTFYNLVVPNYTLSGIEIEKVRYGSEMLNGFVVSIQMPFSKMDLLLMNHISSFLETKYKEQPHTFFHYKNDVSKFLSYLKMQEDANVDIVHQNLWESYITAYLERKKKLLCKATNGKINFTLNPLFFNLPETPKVLFQQLLPAILEYIWKPQYTAIDYPLQVVEVEKGDKQLKDNIFFGLLWTNKLPLFVYGKRYIIFEENKIFYCVRFKHWFPFLQSLLIAFDVSNAKILPVLTNEKFSYFKNEFISKAAKLTLQKTDDKDSWKWMALQH